MKIDSKTLQDSIYSSKPVAEKTTRHIIAWMKQQLDENAIEQVDLVSSKENLADVFTKKGVNADTIIRTVKNGRIEN